jgi:hypothetical protein
MPPMPSMLLMLPSVAFTSSPFVVREDGYTVVTH